MTCNSTAQNAFIYVWIWNWDVSEKKREEKHPNGKTISQLRENLHRTAPADMKLKKELAIDTQYQKTSTHTRGKSNAIMN